MITDDEERRLIMALIGLIDASVQPMAEGGLDPLYAGPAAAEPTASRGDPAPGDRKWPGQDS